MSDDLVKRAYDAANLWRDEPVGTLLFQLAQRIEALEKALREVVVAYDRSFPMRTADAHYNCDCLRCTVDRAEGALK